jgi:hypothetical protein
VRPTLIRRRVAQAIVFVALLAFAPVLARELWPSAARFVPPSLLLLLAALTAFLALAAWRTEWLVRVLFADPLQPERLAKLQKELPRQRVTAAIGLVVTGVLIAAWIKSLP